MIGKKNEKAKLWSEGRIGLFEKLEKAFSKQHHHNIIWVHCASLGEFEQGRPLIEAIKAKYPASKILLTFFSPSGYEVSKNYVGADWVFYLPMDNPRNAKRFYSIVNPNIVIFIKYEFWYYYLQEAKQRNIPLILVSGVFREGQAFFKWYGSFKREMLLFFTHLFVQNQQSFDLLGSTGLTKNVTLSGDTRFDRVITIAAQFKPIPEIEAFLSNAQKIIVAGSTWLEDDNELYHYAKAHPNFYFIVAPHDIQQSRIDDCLSIYPNSITFSDWKEEQRRIEEGIQIEKHTYNTLIINNVVMLSRLYAYATICFVGGGFGNDGVHNVLEAAVYGKPVIFGPEYSKYQEATQLIQHKGGFSIEDVFTLESTMNNLIEDSVFYSKTCKAASNYVNNMAGATKKVMQWVDKWMN